MRNQGCVCIGDAVCQGLCLARSEECQPGNCFPGAGDRMDGTIVFRVDAGPTIGMGHVVRCIALGQACVAAGKKVVFVTASHAPEVHAAIHREGFHVEVLPEACPAPSDVQGTMAVLGRGSCCWLVLDGYHFDAEYQQQVKQAGHRLMVIDDTVHCDHYYADLILNQNINAEHAVYCQEPYTRCLLGTSYALLRKPFLERLQWTRPVADRARNVLVTLGGGDSANTAGKAILALDKTQFPGLAGVVVAGPVNAQAGKLETLCRQCSAAVKLLPSVDNMSELMAWADIAITAAGSTCWELAFMQLPALVLTVADNQDGIGAALAQRGSVLDLGRADQIAPGGIAHSLLQLLGDPQKRRAMSAAGRAVVDGFGSQRVLESMTALSRTA